jgi:hypothetical protein
VEGLGLKVFSSTKLLKSKMFTGQIQFGRPQSFFHGRAKFSRGGGQEPTFCLKNNKKDTIFPKKFQKHTIFGQPWPARGGARAPPCPPLRTPMKSSQPFLNEIQVLFSNSVQMIVLFLM